MGFFDSIKKKAYDNFLQKVVCSCCQNEVKIMNTYKLADGNLICGKCMNKIPLEFCFSPNSETIEKVEKIINYMTYSKTELEPIFKSNPDTVLWDFKFDPAHGLFTVGTDSKMIFKLSDIELFDMRFVAKEYKENTFSVKKCTVTGDILLDLRVKESELVPMAHYSKTVAYGIETTGVKKGFMGSELIISDPPGMTTFLARIAPYINV